MPNTTTRTTGRNLTILLYDKKISQKEVADAVGVSEVTISKLVNGTQAVSVEKLAGIADFLGVSMDELLNCNNERSEKNE